MTTTATKKSRKPSKQRAQTELSQEELKFLKEVIQEARHGSGKMLVSGWYPSLFYFGREDSNNADALVADVHTDPPAPLVADPGCVLHQGVGNVDLLMVAIDSGKDRMIFAGPVLSHYEFEMSGVSRKASWECQLKINPGLGKGPPRPEWTQAYVIPRPSPSRGTQ
jgi:hypothetical protein